MNVFDDIWQKIILTIKEFFADAIINSLTGLCDDINNVTMNMGTEVGKTPEIWNSAIFSTVKNIAESVILPIGGVFLTYVLVKQLYSMVVEQNNFKNFEIGHFVAYLFKMMIGVLILSHTFDIASGIFEIAHYVVGQMAGLIGATSIQDMDFSAMKAQLVQDSMGSLVLTVIQVLMIRIMVFFLSILIQVIVYGRMVEVYIYLSIAPIPFSTFADTDSSTTGKNYLKNLLALAFQGFFIMVVIAVYSALISSLITSADIHSAITSVAVCTLVLLFVVMKTGSIAKSIFGSH